MSKSKKKNSKAIIFGVAFIWFTTHFGGGFASGAQLYSYFVKYGKWCFILPIFSMLYNAFFYIYALRYARKHEVYDYRSYNNKFYGKYAPIFSNLFEVLYIGVMCVAPAVAFATGGSTLAEISGMPYWLCTLIIGVFIFIVAIYGTDIVRKVASGLSILIIVGLFLVYIPNIIAGWGQISNNYQLMKTSSASFGTAFKSAFIYGTFQLANIAVFVQHAKSFDTAKEIDSSMILGFVMNSLMMVMVSLGLMTVVNNPDIGTMKVPTLFMIQQGVGSSYLTPLISVLIILGAVSTAVNMVAAMVKRVGVSVMKPEEIEHEEITGKPHFKSIIIALICCLIDFGIAQFGLLALIAKAYSSIAYLAIPVIFIPYIIHMIVTRFDTKEIGN